MLDPHSEACLEKQKRKALERLKKSASGYVLVKRFNAASRAGLRKCIDEGTVEIKETTFGPAYALVQKSQAPPT